MKPNTTEFKGEETPEFIRMVDWFNNWLENPLSERERTIIAEALDYNLKKEAVHARYH